MVKIFGVLGNKTSNMTEIGDEFKLTKERIRQIKKAAMEKLKKHQNMDTLLTIFNESIRDIKDIISIVLLVGVIFSDRS